MLHRKLLLAGHHGGVGQHLMIMRGVKHDKTFRLAKHGSVTTISRNCLQVRVHSIFPMTDSDVNMRRHMNLMSQTRLQNAQPIGGG
jgi:hypothetical protein